MADNVRKMPIPASDTLQRGRQRSDLVDFDETVMQHVLQQLKQEDSTDEETAWVNIRRILRAIPRNNPNDPFKPYSEIAIKELAQGCPVEPYKLLAQEEELLQQYGYDLDRCTIFDKPNPPVKRPDIPKECQYILNRYPAWLRCLIEARFDQIQKKYGAQTPIFFKMLLQRLEYQRTRETHAGSDHHKGDQEDLDHYLIEQYDVEDDYLFIADDVKEADEIRKEIAMEEEMEMVMDPFRPMPEDKIHDAHDNEEKNKRTRVKFDQSATDEIKKIKRMEEAHNRAMWSPILTHKAGDALRATLVAGASETEDEDYYEEGHDEIVWKKEREKGVVRQKDEEFVYRGTHWEAIVAEKSGFMDEATEIMNEEFMRPNVLKEHRRSKRQEAVEKRKQQRKAKKEIKIAVKQKTTHPLLRESGQRQKDAATYRERGVGKRPSRFFVRSPCDGPIVEVERRLHQSRKLEAWRAYANWIAASATFKYFILIIIVGNAALLALETGDFRNVYNYAFDIMDSFFLSVYVSEFLLKFFAYPNQYFMSGFNCFDFVILVVSLIKAIGDWTNYAEFTYLRFLTIIRALRILRGVSLSIHIQVLVRALLDTLKNHVFSVVILLILLMYITSIVAFYLYGSISGLDDMFGRFDKGMLRLFAFVTMDGWTVIMDAFTDVNKHVEGRLFCLILIILGNFLFSNIFIAIIIMQISDSTEAFRKTRADATDIKVSMKQDQVFRRQKVDMRQLLARQRLGVSDDFYELGGRFVRKLRHDDLVDNHSILFSPLWIDSLYKAMQRAHHTSNIIMNQHRKMADRLIRLGHIYDENKLNVQGLSRARYNRYHEVKAKLRLIKEQFLTLRNVKPKPKTRVRWPLDSKGKSLFHAGLFAASMRKPYGSKNSSPHASTTKADAPPDEKATAPSPARPSVGKAAPQAPPHPPAAKASPHPTQPPAKAVPAPASPSVAKANPTAVQTPAKPALTTAKVSPAPAKPPPAPTTAKVSPAPAKPPPAPTTAKVAPAPAKPPPAPTTAKVAPAPAKPPPAPTTAKVSPAPAKPPPAPTTAKVAPAPAKPPPAPTTAKVAPAAAKPAPPPTQTPATMQGGNKQAKK